MQRVSGKCAHVAFSTPAARRSPYSSTKADPVVVKAYMAWEQRAVSMGPPKRCRGIEGLARTLPVITALLTPLGHLAAFDSFCFVSLLFASPRLSLVDSYDRTTRKLAHVCFIHG